MPLTPADAFRMLREYTSIYSTQKEAAAALGISVPYLRDLLHKKRDLSDTVLKKLGIKRTVILELRED